MTKTESSGLPEAPEKPASPAMIDGLEAAGRWFLDLYGGFHSHGGTPIAGWFVLEKPFKMEDLGVPLFQETSIYTQVHSFPGGIDK